MAGYNPLDWFSSGSGSNSVGIPQAQQGMSVNDLMMGLPARPNADTTGIPGLNVPNSAAAAPGWMGISGLGPNIGTMQLGLGALGAGFNIWNGMQAQNLAKQQFAFTKDTTNRNLTNQLQSYNTALSDRARARGVQESQSSAQVQDYIARNRLA